MELDNNFCWWRKSVHHANQPKGGLSHYLGGFVHPLCMTAYIKNIVCSPMYVFPSFFPPYTNLVQDFVYQLVSKKPVPSLHLQLRCQNHSQGPQIFCCLKCSSKHWNLGKLSMATGLGWSNHQDSCRIFHTSSRITKFWTYVRSPECSYIYIYILDQAGVSLLMILREGPNSWDVQWELQWDKQPIVYLAYSPRQGTWTINNKSWTVGDISCLTCLKQVPGWKMGPSCDWKSLSKNSIR